MKQLKFIVIISLFFTNVVFSFPKDSNSCQAEIQDINFGSYSPFDLRIKRTYSLLKLKCSIKNNKAFFSIKLRGGNSSNPFRRYMYSPSTGGKLYYFLSVGGKCRFGDGTGGTCSINGRIKKGKKFYSEKTFTIVGVIPPGQNVPAAKDYRDTLIVTVEY